METQETSWWQLGSPTPHCATLVLWPMRWEMDCPPLVTGQYCRGSSRSAPHSSVHYSFCNQAEKQQSLLTFFKVKTVCIPFSQSVRYTWLREVQLAVPRSEKAPGQAVGVCVGERYASLLESNKSLEWSLGRSDLPIAKRRMFMDWSRLFPGHILWCNGKLKGR